MISEISTWFGNLTHTKSYTYLVQGARLSGLTPPTRRLALAVQWHPSAATQGLSLTVPIWRPTRRVSLAAAVTVTVPQPWDSQAWPGLELGPHEAARSTSNWVGQCTASLTLPNLNCVVPIIIISDCPPGCQSRCATDSGSSRCSHGQSSDRHSCRVRVKGASRSLETCYASRASSSSILALSVWISIRLPSSFPWGRRSLLWTPSSLARRYVIAKLIIPATMSLSFITICRVLSSIIASSFEMSWPCISWTSRREYTPQWHSVEDLHCTGCWKTDL